MLQFPSEWLYPSDLKIAAEIQRLMASRVITYDAWEERKLAIAGVDVSNSIREPEKIYAAAVLLERSSLQLRCRKAVSCIQQFPYIPGFLGFREAPALLEALADFEGDYDLVMVDGHGISHPRGLGIASHLGVLLDRPTVGVAKSILVGKIEGVLGSEVGDWVPLVWKGATVAAAVRTKVRCNPLFISVGHRISLESAIKWVLESLRGYKLPEPTRQAHLAANIARRTDTKDVCP